MKLIQALKCLPPREYTAFENFLENDLVNKRKDLIAFFSELKSNSLKITEQHNIYANIYPNSIEFESTKWRLLCSRLLKVLEQYFAFSSYCTDKSKQQIDLGTFYIQNKKEKLYTIAKESGLKQLNKTPNQTEKYWKEKYEWHTMNYAFIESQNRRKKTNLDEMSKDLDIFYFISKLKIALREMSRAVINAETYSIHMLQEVITNIEKNNFWLEIPAIKVYYSCYKAIHKKGTELDFQNLRKSIQQHQDIFTNAELRDLHLVAINYCIRKLNTGKEKYNREALELYRLSLTAGLLLEDGFLPAPAYNNIVTLSIKENEFDWAATFIKEYKDSLKASMRKSMHEFCSAKIHFSQNKLDDCLIILASISNNIPFIYLGAKTMQIKIFIEKNEIDALESLLDSLRVYIQRRKDLGYRKHNYTNLIKFSKRLLQLPIMSKKDKSEFRNDIESAEIFTEKKWFLDRVN